MIQWLRQKKKHGPPPFVSHTVEREEDINKYISMFGDRRTGKTESLVCIALGHAKRSPGSRVHIFCKDANQAVYVAFRLKEAATDFDWKFTSRRSSVELENKSIIEVIPVSSQNVKGRSAEMVLADNIDTFSRDEQLAVFAMAYNSNFRAFTSEKPYTHIGDYNGR